MGVRAPFYLEGATLAFSVKKLRVLREEKKKIEGFEEFGEGSQREARTLGERWKGS